MIKGVTPGLPNLTMVMPGANRTDDQGLMLGSPNSKHGDSDAGLDEILSPACKPGPVYRARRRSPSRRGCVMENRLQRAVFATSRLIEFCSIKELTAQTGHTPDQWPLVIGKELIDNALDEAEKSGVAPIVNIEVCNGEIIMTDNGPGIPAATISKILDFTVRASDKEAYVSPTRGAQGNALKTIVAMAFALDRTSGVTVIEAHGIKHTITFTVDAVRREPKVLHVQDTSFVTTGTRIAVLWPVCASSQLEAAKARFLQIATDFTFLNPHLTLRVVWEGKDELHAMAAESGWKKWSPSDPIPAHWYDADRFERLVAAHIAHDQDNGGDMLVREFVATFRGLSGSTKQKGVLDEVDAARVSLAKFFAEGENRNGIALLLAAMQKLSKPVKPNDLGLIGPDHLARRFGEVGAEMGTFKYTKDAGTADGLPWVIEVAFAWARKAKQRRLITGVNFSPGITNPFRSLGAIGQSLDTILANQHANRNDPVIVLIHITSPRLSFTDRGKSALALGSDNADGITPDEADVDHDDVDDDGDEA
jgi:DNA topoisomerase VI subunit B